MKPGDYLNLLPFTPRSAPVVSRPPGEREQRAMVFNTAELRRRLAHHEAAGA